MSKVSRSHVARYATAQLQTGNLSREQLVQQLAAWLKASKQKRQGDYLINDIAKKLAESGYLYVTVTSAHALAPETKQKVIDFLRAQYGQSIQLELSEQVQSAVIGGIRIETPMGAMDATVKRKLIHIIKGVSR